MGLYFTGPVVAKKISDDEKFTPYTGSTSLFPKSEITEKKTPTLFEATKSLLNPLSSVANQLGNKAIDAILETKKDLTPPVIDPVLKSKLQERGRFEDLKKLEESGVVVPGLDKLYTPAQQFTPEQEAYFGNKMVHDMTQDKVMKEDYDNQIASTGQFTARDYTPEIQNRLQQTIDDIRKNKSVTYGIKKVFETPSVSNAVTQLVENYNKGGYPLDKQLIDNFNNEVNNLVDADKVTFEDIQKAYYFKPQTPTLFINNAKKDLIKDNIAYNVEPIGNLYNPPQKIDKFNGMAQSVWLTSGKIKSGSLLEKSGLTFNPSYPLISDFLKPFNMFKKDGAIKPEIKNIVDNRTRTAFNDTGNAIAFCKASSIFPVSGPIPLASSVLGTIAYLQGERDEIVLADMLTATTLPGASLITQNQAKEIIKNEAKKNVTNKTDIKLSKNYTDIDIETARNASILNADKDVKSVEATNRSAEYLKSLDPIERVFTGYMNPFKNYQKNVKLIGQELQAITGSNLPFQFTPADVNDVVCETVSGTPKFTDSGALVIGDMKTSPMGGTLVGLFSDNTVRENFDKRLVTLKEVFQRVEPKDKKKVGNVIDILSGIGRQLGYIGERLTDATEVILPQEIIAKDSQLAKVVQSGIQLSEATAEKIGKPFADFVIDMERMTPPMVRGFLGKPIYQATLEPIMKEKVLKGEKEIAPKIGEVAGWIGAFGALSSAIGSVAVSSEVLRPLIVRAPFISKIAQYAVSRAVLDQLHAELNTSLEGRQKIIYQNLPRYLGWGIGGAVAPKELIWMPSVFLGEFASSKLKGQTNKQAFKNGLFAIALMSLFKLPDVIQDPYTILKEQARKTLGVGKNATPKEAFEAFEKLQVEFSASRSPENLQKLLIITDSLDYFREHPQDAIDELKLEIKNLYNYFNSPDFQGTSLDIIREMPYGLSIKETTPFENAIDIVKNNLPDQLDRYSKEAGNIIRKIDFSKVKSIDETEKLIESKLPEKLLSNKAINNSIDNWINTAKIYIQETGGGEVSKAIPAFTPTLITPATPLALQGVQPPSAVVDDITQVLRGTKGMTAEDIVKEYPDIQLRKDVPVKDIYGNKVEIPEGEALTPYELKGNKILLQDGETYIVSKNQFQNIKGQSIVAESKPFALELEGLEETIRGEAPKIEKKISTPLFSKKVTKEPSMAEMGYIGIRGKFDFAVDDAKELVRRLLPEADVQFLEQDKIIVVQDGKEIELDGLYNPRFEPGRMTKSLMQVVQNKGLVRSRTVLHEAMHAYLDHFLTDTEVTKIREMVRVKYNLPTTRAAEERIADEFPEYLKTKRTWSDRLRTFFRSVVSRVKNWIGIDTQIKGEMAKENPDIKKLFTDMIEGKREVIPIGEKFTRDFDIKAARTKAPTKLPIQPEEFSKDSLIKTVDLVKKTALKLPTQKERSKAIGNILHAKYPDMSDNEIKLAKSIVGKILRGKDFNTAAKEVLLGVKPSVLTKATPAKEIMPLKKPTKMKEVITTKIPKDLKPPKGIEHIKGVRKGVTAFIDEKFITAKEKTIDFLGDVEKSILNKIAPTALGDTSKLTASVIRAKMAELARQKDMAWKAGEEKRAWLNKAGTAVKEELIDSMELGKLTGPLRGLGKETTDVLTSLIKEYKIRLNNSYLTSASVDERIGYIKNYMPHIWKKPEVAIRFFDEWEARIGREAFAKKRLIETIREGKEAGLELVTDNLEELVTMREVSGWQAKTQLETIEQLEELGLLKTPSEIKKMSGYAVLTTPYGKFGMPEEVATIVNNWLRPGLWENKQLSGTLFKGGMEAKNFVVAAKLALSLWHYVSTASSDVAVQTMMVAKDLGRGDFGKFFEDLAKVPVSPFLDLIEGGDIKKAWFDGPKTDNQQDAIDLLQRAGGRPLMSKIYRINARENFLKAVHNSDYLGVGERTIPAVLETLAVPLLDEWTPRLKLASFNKVAKDFVIHHPELSEEELNIELARIWDETDNRFGQLVTDNLFWNPILKDVAVATTFSLGWGLGTFREVGGATIDTAKALEKLAEFKKPEITDKMLFVTSYAIIWALIGGLITYAMTGKRPKKIFDYFYPKTGDKNPDGTAKRFQQPTMAKEVFRTYSIAQKYGIKEMPWRILKDKLNPVINTTWRLWENKDFYGAEIYNPNADIHKKAQEISNFLLQEGITPIALSDAYQDYVSTNKIGAGTFLPFLGFTHAPKYITTTKTIKNIEALYEKRFGGGTISKEEANKRKKKSELRIKFQKGKLTHGDIDKAIRTGILTSKGLSSFLKSATLPSDVRLFGVLSSTDQDALLQDMTEKERGKYLPQANNDIKVKYKYHY